jgi:hypothetical protein
MSDDQEEGGYSLSILETELEQLRLDYVAFSRSYDIIRKRLLDSNEVKRLIDLHTWSGARAICGSFELSIHAIERTISAHEELIRRVVAGELKNTDRSAKPVLSIVRENDKQ